MRVPLQCTCRLSDRAEYRARWWELSGVGLTVRSLRNGAFSPRGDCRARLRFLVFCRAAGLAGGKREVFAQPVGIGFKSICRVARRRVRVKSLLPHCGPKRPRPFALIAFELVGDPEQRAENHGSVVVGEIDEF